MKCSWTFAIVLAACLSAGCVSTLNPLYSKDVAAQDPAIEGIWFEESDTPLAGEGRRWQSISISKSPQDGDPGGYSIAFDTPESSKIYSAHLVELRGGRYLDVFSLGEVANLDAVPVHFIMRLEVSKNRFALAALDKQKVQQILNLEEPDFPVSQIGQRLVFTGSTAELQAFFVKYGDRVFGEGQILKKRPAKIAVE